MDEYKGLLEVANVFDERLLRPLHNSCLLPPNKNFQFFEKTQPKKHHFSFFRAALAAFLGCFHVLGAALL